MEQHGSNGTADHGKLFVGIGRSVVRIKLRRNAMSGNGGLKDLLEVGGGILIEQGTGDDEP